MPFHLIVLGFSLAILPAAHAKVDTKNAKSVMDEVAKNLDSKDEVASLKMEITEADGAKKTRDIEIRRKKGDKHKALVKIQSPADLKGTSLLSVGTDQWLYLPSSKQTRRIVSSKRSSNFMDSELSYEDMGAGADAGFESKVLKTEKINGRDFIVVESTPKGESTYSKILAYVDAQNFLLGKSEIYDKAGKLMKTTAFSGYKQFDKVWRAQKIEVKNLQNKRGTTLELADLKLNKGLDDDEFTESALTDE